MMVNQVELSDNKVFVNGHELNKETSRILVNRIGGSPFYNIYFLDINNHKKIWCGIQMGLKESKEIADEYSKMAGCIDVFLN